MEVELQMNPDSQSTDDVEVGAIVGENEGG